MGLKLDVSKAHDRMEWDFIDETLEAFGFQTEFIQIIRGCMGSISFFILLNRSPFGNFIPSRGFRQGNPLYLYHLILGTVDLSRMVVRARNEGDI